MGRRAAAPGEGDRAGPWRAVGRRAAALVASLAVACGAETPPPAPDSGVGDAGRTCVRSSECPSGHRCAEGVCVTLAEEDGGSVRVDAGGELPPGHVTADPPSVELGAVRFGNPTTRTVVAGNSGPGPLKLLLAYVDDDPAGEFQVQVPRALPATLLPGNGVPIQVRYLPRDGSDDLAALVLVSDDPERVLFRVPLRSEWKGVPEVAIVEDPATSAPEVRRLDFGNVATGATQTRSFFVKNAGTGTNPVLGVLSARVDPPGSPRFTARTSTALPAYLNLFAPGALCPMTGTSSCAGGRTCESGVCRPLLDMVEVSVTFSPREAGPVAESLVITTDEDHGAGDEASVTIALAGAGIEGRLQIAPDPIDLGVVFAGFPRTATIAFTASGGADVELARAEVNAPGLRLDLRGRALPITLTPAAPRFEAAVIAEPARAGPIAATLEVTSTDQRMPSRRVAITGRALLPPVAEIEARVDLGDVHVVRPGLAPARRETVVANRGGSELQVSAIALAPGSSPALAVSPPSLAPIAPNGEARVELTFSPSAVGTATGALVLATNDPARRLIRVPITARAIDPTIRVRPGRSLDFGRVLPGAFSETTTITVENTGSGPLVIQSIRATSGSSPDLQLVRVPALPATLATAQDRLAFAVRYAPTTVGPDTAAIEIASTDLDDALVSIELFGQGTSCPPDTWDLDMNPMNGCEYVCAAASPPIERCNGRDDDCNGTPDDGFGIGAPCTGVGICGAGVIECAAGDPTRSTCSTNPGQSASQARPETCDGRDEDCDGTVDDGFDLDRSLLHCGRCNTPCTAANGTPECVFGQCRVAACDPGFADCDRTASTGCEIRTATDLDHCGACNAACRPPNASAQCALGRCSIVACAMGFDDCDSDARTGCETDTTRSLDHCGGCRRPCTVTNGTPRCQGGACEIAACNPGFGDCDAMLSTGCEAPLTTLADCGRCDRACDLPRASESCATESCALISCESGYGNCNMLESDGCETPLDTAANCGMCGQSCGVNALCCGTGAGCRPTGPADCGACNRTCTPGMLVITELMIDPAAVTDTAGEWIELHNPGTTPIDLRGMRLRDLGSDSHVIRAVAPLVVPPGGYVVLGRNADMLTNGGVRVDYQYSGMNLANTGDQVILEGFGVEIDRVVYPTAFVSTGASKQLSRTRLDAAANDDLTTWCASSAPLPGGDRGTPGAVNADCP